MQTVIMMGHVSHSLGSFDAAIKCYESAFKFYEAKFGKSHINNGPIIRNIGYTLKTQGQCDKAKESYISAMTIYQKTINDLNLVSDADGANWVYSKLTLEELERQLQIYKKTLGKAHHDWPGPVPC